MIDDHRDPRSRRIAIQRYIGSSARNETWINIRATVKRGRDNIYVTPFPRAVLSLTPAMHPLATRVAVVVSHRAIRRRRATRRLLLRTFALAQNLEML